MEQELLLKKACDLISVNLGELTSSYYKEFYKDKDEAFILSSLRELLTELVGPANADKQLKQAIINVNLENIK
jgi:hypothetical protein